MATSKSDGLINTQILSYHGLGYVMYLKGVTDNIISSRVYTSSIGNANPDFVNKRLKV